MERQEIMIDTLDRALDFVRVINQLDASVYFVKDEDFVNAKSVLGMFSMDFENPLTLEIKGDEEEKNAAINAIHDFISK